MPKALMLILISALLFSYGCAMFTSWKTIPPPGGCDQCHTAAISTDWQIAYKVVVLSDERNREYFQTEAYTMQQTAKPGSVLDLRKLEELQCFECHKTPNAAHKERKGRFHH